MMIIHPDGRLEGTPEELVAYQKSVQAAPTVIIEKQVPVYITQPSTTPVWPIRPFDVWCGSGQHTYVGPELTTWN